MTPLLQRFQQALSAFREAPRRASSVKKAPYAFPLFAADGTAHWIMSDFMTYVREGFDLNSVIYSAVMFKAKAIARARLRAYSGDNDNPVRVEAAHPLAQLVARPNPSQSWLEFQQQREVFLNIAGNSYTWLDRPARNALPTALYNLRPDRMTIVPDTNGVKGFLYTPQSGSPRDRMPFLPQDVIHVKFPNPGDPLEGYGYGLSPLAPMAQSGDVDNAVTGFLKQFIDRGAMLSGIIKTKVPVDDDGIARIKQRWREQYGGAENWGDVGVLDMDADYQRIGLTFKEMDFDTLDARNESRMLGPFGVPPILIGTRLGLQRATFSNAEEARKACWEDTLLPEMELFAADDSYYLKADDGAFVRYDTSEVPSLQQNVIPLIDAAYKLFQMGTPRNQAVAAVGLKLADAPGGDQAYLPATYVRVGAATPITPTSGDNGDNASNDTRDGGASPPQSAALAWRPTTPALASIGGSVTSSLKAQGWSEEAKAQLWAKADKLATDHEDAFRKEAAAQFKLDQREVLALVGDAKRKSLTRKAAIQWEDLLPDVKQTLADAGRRWQEQFVPLIKGVVADAADHWQAEAGLSFDVRNLEAEQWFIDYTAKFSTPITDTSEREIAAILQQGQSDGWSVGQMQTTLTQLFQQWIDGSTDAADFAGERLPPWRAEAIARTETMRAYNAGSTEIYRDNGVEQREWLATLDNRTRDDHAAADGQIVGIDELFSVGDEDLDYPGDPSGSPENTIACRCSTAPIME